LNYSATGTGIGELFRWFLVGWSDFRFWQ